ncbi:MAG: hypothetical protein A3F11_09585 [Gammaproteobacteria bacterium RIFCSPHIGHO2_12_FULL_37_14]|nr:MAG: hypothetical protein A3F11_09585 [Gammaproteobacteria bacterium RIFCSPHIGHO2_12_FULL_37_14]
MKDPKRPFKPDLHYFIFNDNLQSHLNFFNNHAETRKNTTDSSCDTLLVQYRENLKNAIMEHRSLSLQEEGASVEMNHCPTEEEKSDFKKMTQQLNDIHGKIVNCMTFRRA